MEDDKEYSMDCASAFRASTIVARTDFDAQPQLPDASEAASPSSSMQAKSNTKSPAEDLIDTNAAEMTMISTKHTKLHPWEKCPAETRGMIFDEVGRISSFMELYWKWRGSMLPIVVALRGLKQAYKQALHRFEREGGGHLRMCSWRTGFEIGEFNCLELDTLKEVTLDLT